MSSEVQRRAWLVLVVVVVSASVGSLVQSKLALYAGFATLVLALSRPTDLPTRLRRWAASALWVAGLCSGLATLFFVVNEAVPGIVQGGSRATARKAVSTLREILFVQDALRRSALIDADRDGVGSAGLLSELAGSVPARSGAKLTPPPLDVGAAKWVPTPLGPALSRSGYLFLVCLPRTGGGWTAMPGVKIDEERAEREFAVHAWPSAPGRQLLEAFFLDEHERILVTSNTVQGRPVAMGPQSPPSCAPPDPTAGEPRYSPWKGKRARDTLPFDQPRADSP